MRKSTESKVRDLAEQLAKALVQDTRTDGEKFYKLADGSPEWMTEVIHAVHGEKMPDDTTYEFISRCADAIADGSDDPQDAISEIEPDVYTHDLTEWLHRRADHVYYLTEALEDGAKDGFQLLQAAQQKHIMEVGNSLISELEDVDTDDEE
jgi:hypothetical protein